MKEINNVTELIEIFIKAKEEKNLSLLAISKNAEISQSLLTNYFNKKVNMPLHSAIKIANALGLKIFIEE